MTKKTTAPSPFVPFITANDLPDSLITPLCAQLCPPLLAVVDLPAFTRLVCASISLNALSKLRVFRQLPTLSVYQIEALTETFHNEVTEFLQILKEEWPRVADLSAQSWLHTCMVADYLGAGYPNAAAERQALAHMLKRKYREEEHREWIQRAQDFSFLSNHVFSALHDAGTGPRASQARLPSTF